MVQITTIAAGAGSSDIRYDAIVAADGAVREPSFTKEHHDC